MAFARIRFSLWAPALIGLGLAFGSVAPAGAQYFFPWDQPPPPRRMPEAQLSARTVRAILAREGLQMTGQPRARGDEIIAMGIDPEGQRQRVTLDAVSGEVLEVIEVGPSARRQRLEEERRRDSLEREAPPRAPMPPPVHPAVEEPPEGPPSTPKKAQSSPSAPKPAQAAQKPDAPRMDAPRQDPADDALSPIRPMKPAGAPKVEPLPQ